MVLQVAFNDFAAAATRVVGSGADVYLHVNAGSVIATTGKPGTETIVIAKTSRSIEVVRETLEQAGMKVFLGRWTDNFELADMEGGAGKMFVAAVGFKAVGGAPGVWIDAFPSLPTQVQVLRAMFEELSETGEMSEVSFEEFIRLSEANVVMATPDDLEGYLEQKQREEDATSATPS